MLVSIVEPVQFSAETYLDRYRSGVWRDRIFFDMIVDDAKPAGKDLTILDIGCGRGFDGDVPLQKLMATQAGRFIGIEPDKAVQPGPYFHETHACFLEDAPIAPESVDVAYAIMVLEHLAEPQRFWDKLHAILKPGGVFWGLTVDRRHWFCSASSWFDRLRIKDFYLNRILGARGSERYENYPVYYRSNTPTDVDKLAEKFSQARYFNFAREGQLTDYLPKLLAPLTRALDRRAIRRGRPGTMLVMRVQK